MMLFTINNLLFINFGQNNNYFVKGCLSEDLTDSFTPVV